MDSFERIPTFDDGLTAQVKGDFDSAIAIFEQVIEAHPASAEAYHQIGRCHMRLGAIDKAIENLETAVSMGPDRIPARLDLGMLYMAIDDPSKARPHFLSAHSRNKSNVKAITGLGMVCFAERDMGKALSRFQAASVLNPSNLACHYYLAKIHRILKNEDGVAEEAMKSSAICRDLIRVRSELPEAYFFLAESFVFQKEYKGALQNYLIAKDFSAEGVLHFFAFGLHYMLIDNYMGIARCYRRLGENRYARYFGQLMLQIDSNNKEAEKYASIED